MSTNPSVVKIKSKADPEALLNDLSTSLKSFSSTVRTWTAAGEPANSNGSNVEMTMRPARLGLGAKPVKASVEGVVGGDGGVSANLKLRKQITGSTAGRVEKTRSSIVFRGHGNKVVKPKSGKKSDDDEDGGRASMISRNNKNPSSK